MSDYIRTRDENARLFDIYWGELTDEQWSVLAVYHGEAEFPSLEDGEAVRRHFDRFNELEELGLTRRVQDEFSATPLGQEMYRRYVEAKNG